MIHLLPGMNEMSFEVMKQQINVLTAMHGIAATVGSARVYLNTVAHNPSQKICIRYIPSLSFDISVMIRGAFELLLHVNMRSVPPVSRTRLIVQKAHPISITGVERVSPGIAWL